MPHKTMPIVGLAMIVFAAAATVREVGGATPVPPTAKASENTDYDVASGLPVTVIGALDDDDSTYDRVESAACVNFPGNNVPYDTITLGNTSGILASLDVTTSRVGNPATCSGAGDTVLSVYQPTFNAADPTANCESANDDGGPGVCSRLRFDLGVGETAVVVVTAISDGARFDYQVNVDTPACSDAVVYDDGSVEDALRGPMGTRTFEITQRFDLPLIGSGGAEVERVCACLSRTVSATADFPVNFVVRRPTAAGDRPGARLHTEPVMAMDVPEFPTCRFFNANLTGVAFASDTVFIGVEWQQDAFPELLISHDTGGATTQPGFYTTNQGGTWSATTGLGPGYRNLAVRARFDEPFTALSDSSGLLLPGFELDLDDPSGPTTFLNVRNTTDDDLELNVHFHGDEVTDAPRRVDPDAVLPQAVSVTDLRGDTTGLDPDGDGVATGLVVVSRADTGDATDLEGDYLSVDFGNDFASGDRLFRLPGDLCDRMEIRFLDFGSGTRLTIVVDEPQGDVAPTFTYSVYNQAGTAIVSDGEYFTNTHLNTVDVADLAGAGNRFGTVVVDFSAAGGGLAVAKYSAFGRFSVELDGACRDEPN